jgi:hypothetical protein
VETNLPGYNIPIWNSYLENSYLEFSLWISPVQLIYPNKNLKHLLPNYNKNDIFLRWLLTSFVPPMWNYLKHRDYNFHAFLLY